MKVGIHRRALIVDDEAAARKDLRELLAAHQEIEIVGEAKNVTDALAQFRKTKPNLIFLDVQMPRRDGFSLLPDLIPVPSMTNIISPLTGGVTQVQDGGYQDAIAAGIQAGGQIYSQRLLEGLEKEPYYVRVPAGTLFYLYVTQTVNVAQATTGLSAANSTQSAK